MQRKLFLIPFLLLSAALCRADGIVTLSYTGAGSNQIDGFWTYPYSVAVDGGSPASMLCDDFTDEIFPGYKWLASANALTPANVENNDFLYSGSQTFGAGEITAMPGSDLQAYDEAAYILTGIVGGTIGNSEGNAAIWYLFSPTATSSAIGGDTVARGILDQAYTSVQSDPSYNYSNITIYTPEPNGIISPAGTPGEGQEFLTITGGLPGSATPEPPPSLLLWTGAALICVVRSVRGKRLART
jgi:hypothetical protein